jgi:formate dehydrogenase iron-sulfur subunit
LGPPSVVLRLTIQSILLFTHCFVKNVHASRENLHWIALLLGIGSAFSPAMGERPVFADAANATLLDQLIAEQQELTAVAEFARAHDRGEITTSRYSRLMPVGAPGAGQQFAFDVDLDRCSGCKACVTACHALNGLDDGEAWRQVGTLISEDWRRPFRQTVPTTCHHCAEPACLTGCPVLAYEKDPVTGIVRHLDDQCIGCQYCVMMCPYEVPQYSKRRGIVRKCDMCSQRLSVGEAPACVQACPSEAIRITIVDQGKLQAIYRTESTSCQAPSNDFLPTSPDPAITLPSTRFTSRRPLAPDLIQGDAAEFRPQPAHTPLVLMLVLTQLGVGGAAFAQLVPSNGPSRLLWLALIATVAGLGASVAHLGKPSKAWRSFLGLRTSWLSREIVAFGVFATVLGIAAVTRSAVAIGFAALTGIVGVLSSAFVYQATHRVFWIGAGSFGKFFGSTLLLGAAAAWLAVGASWLAITTGIAALLKMAIERNALACAHSTAQLMLDRFGLAARLRSLCAFAVVAASFLSLLAADMVLVLAAATLVLALMGELIERSLFFRTVVPPRMPGAL